VLPNARIARRIACPAAHAQHPRRAIADACRLAGGAGARFLHGRTPTELQHVEMVAVIGQPRKDRNKEAFQIGKARPVPGDEQDPITRRRGRATLCHR
jgi:hypothetical protein